MEVSRVSGTNPRANPLDFVRSGRAFGEDGEADGSTATTLTPGLRDLRYLPTPVTVPPVPTPATKMSTLPSVSSQISGPVVRKWASGLAWFTNWPGMKLFGSSAASSSALRNGSLHALCPVRQHQFRAVGFQQVAALHAHGFRHRQDESGTRGR